MWRGVVSSLFVHKILIVWHSLWTIIPTYFLDTEIEWNQTWLMLLSFETPATSLATSSPKCSRTSRRSRPVSSTTSWRTPAIIVSITCFNHVREPKWLLLILGHSTWAQLINGRKIHCNSSSSVESHDLDICSQEFPQCGWTYQASRRLYTRLKWEAYTFALLRRNQSSKNFSSVDAMCNIGLPSFPRLASIRILCIIYSPPHLGNQCLQMSARIMNVVEIPELTILIYGEQKYEEGWKNFRILEGNRKQQCAHLWF